MIGLASLPFPVFADSGAQISIPVLSEPALQVASPDKVLLIAVTNAANRLVAVGVHGVIVYSDNNGVSWSQARVPVSVTLTCVAFATPLIGWAAGNFGVILNTADGGKTWRLQLNGIQADQLTLAAAQVASTQNSSSPGAPLALRRADIFMRQGPARPFLTLVALSPQRVIVFGAYRMTMISNDGGISWADWSLRIDDPVSHDLYGSAVVGENIYVVGEEGLVFCSTDGGNTFPQLTPSGNSTLFGFVGTADGSILVYGVAGTAFRSSDDGKSWSRLTINTNIDLVAGARLSSGNILLASEAGEGFISKDNGQTFQGVTGMPHTDVTDFQQVDSEIIFVGADGVSIRPVSSIDI